MPDTPTTTHTDTPTTDRAALINDIMQACGGPVVSRSRASEITGGLIGPRTLANYDSAGRGPAGRIKIGKSAGYLSESFAEWLADRIAKVGGPDHQGRRPGQVTMAGRNKEGSNA
jgi:hypothetical protein